MKCRDIQQLLSEHIDGVLDADSERRLKEHLDGCEDCRAELAALKNAVGLVQQLDSVEPPGDLLAGIHAKLARSQSPGGRLLDVVWNPQVRVGIAACLLIGVCVVSYRHIERDQLAPTAPPDESPVGEESDARDDVHAEMNEAEQASVPARRQLQTDKARKPADALQPEAVAGLKASSVETVTAKKKREYAKSVGPREAKGAIWKSDAIDSRASRPRKAQERATASPAAAPTATAINQDAALLKGAEVMRDEEAPHADVAPTPIAAKRGAGAVANTTAREEGDADALLPGLPVKESVPARLSRSMGFAGRSAMARSRAVAPPTLTVASKDREAVMKLFNTFDVGQDARTKAVTDETKASTLTESAGATSIDGILTIRIHTRRYEELLEALKTLGTVTTHLSVKKAEDAGHITVIRARIVQP